MQHQISFGFPPKLINILNTKYSVNTFIRINAYINKIFHQNVKINLYLQVRAVLLSYARTDGPGKPSAPWRRAGSKHVHTGGPERQLRALHPAPSPRWCRAGGAKARPVWLTPSCHSHRCLIDILEWLVPSHHLASVMRKMKENFL